MARIKPQALLLQSKKKKGPSGVSVNTIIVCILIVAVMVFSLYSTYRYWFRRSIVQTQDDLSTSKAIERKKSDIPKYALISTSKGLITVELYKDGSPDIVDEFIDFSQKGHFKEMQFIRVIKDSVIHGSKVERPEATEEWTLRGKHYSQLDPSLKHEAFMLGTSKVKHEGGGFDLFVTTAPIPDLNDKINVFGRVIKGEEVVQEIEEVDTDDHHRPKTRVQINEVTLKQRT
ncbi:PREDICTED: peptidyl-prolyl cis-trans isomerase CYP21-4-like [Nicotiana attenuata]|uniref:Peptidyl-prolyl cis-trans isomerase n=1 Tax=Nicotiana attenuata TaxID=49451 RepID=A0A1J6IJL3_NICAT|nr:PREDICTED: peptidyl-prolyl cis-trans isomerase CYP21-4-like [Nicotiana attenuata]XP_019254598.1 PREDICTED: peptidyl-prolyl cis-trans isomerase CYP21-4-like [Nicotiana attenuata]OIS97910.1 peptidyl-prolyl cis-trans isomerase cyp21-4 [Nicotiana attenuata]